MSMYLSSIYTGGSQKSLSTFWKAGRQPLQEEVYINEHHLKNSEKSLKTGLMLWNDA